MEWNIPSENAIITRLDELYEALDRFPDSPMAQPGSTRSST